MTLKLTDPKDVNLSGTELKAKYDAQNPDMNAWSVHPDYPHEDWAQAASELDTLQGYWDWVAHQIDALLIEQEESDED
ncbi:hypothetical protein [Neptuniibacter sp. QD37_11]|uniref:hypothetical protein n=1 Tax=Neptuniibacter sp. QD37_11 TaxID=3398209 RepID=UPI0039F4EBE9